MSMAVDYKFADQVRRGPARIAVADPSAELTYRALDHAVTALAEQLPTALGEETLPVCVFTDKGVAMTTAMLGVFRRRGVYVPLDPADPDLRIAALVDRIQPAAILATVPLRQRLSAILAGRTAPPPPVILLSGSGEILASEPGQQPTSPFRHDAAVPGLRGRPAYVFFTSGSTGMPKAIVGSDRSLAHFLAWECEAFSITAADRFSQLGAISSDASLKDTLVPLASGGSVQIPPTDGITGAALADWVGKARITVIGTVPTLFRTLLEALKADSAAVRRLAQSLRIVLLAGETLRPAWVQRWLALFGSAVPLINLYGATEATVFSVFNPIRLPPRAGSATVPVGRAIAGTEILVLNRAMRPCAVGELGEIHLRSDYLSLGYLSDDAATRRSFWCDTNGRVTYRTGDLGRLRSDGTLDFVGRADAQLKIRGVRVQPTEVETLLVGQPGVQDAVVIARPDATGEAELAAHVLKDATVAADAAALRRHLALHLPPALVPSRIFFHAAFPQTHNGKIDRRALARARVPETPPPSCSLTPTEEILAGLWGEILERPSRAEDDFFDLGGHSLLAMQLQARIDEAFSVRPSLADLFEAPRLGDMAARIASLRAKRAPERPATAPIADSAGLLSSGQQRLWFLNQLDPDSGFYNLHAAFRLSGPVRTDALAAAVASLLKRHEILRSTIIMADGTPRLSVQLPQPVEIPVMELTQLEPAVREGEARRLAQEEVARPFDLSKGPLLRLLLMCLGPADHVAVMTLHHIVGDMWSCAILARDLSALYAAQMAGEASPLPALSARYIDHVRAEATHLDGGSFVRLRDFWMMTLAGVSGRPGLPHDGATARRRRFRGGHVERRLTLGLTRDLVDLARAHRATLFMVMLAGFTTVLRHRGGGEDLLVGTDVAGRNGTDAEEVVGFFVNQLVLRCDLAGNPSFGALLARLKATALAAYDHAAMPFDRLVRLCNPRRDPVAPIFTVKLVGQTVPRPDLSLQGVEVGPFAVPRETAQIDLNLRFTLDAHGMWLSGEYDADLFLPSTIADVLDQLETVLARVAREPEIHLDALDRMMEAQDLRRWATAGRRAPSARLSVPERAGR